jgi:kinesin family protein 4/21/27
VSFLEIYGEDVYDLSMAAISNRGGSNLERPSLPVRENDSGMVFVQGLQESMVQSAREALDLLYQGSQNRTTGSTAMNAGSSRSHAVFTITLDQRVQSSDSDDDVQIMTSKLTFVDLAGSERLKRTGAEGQRMKEGIQINSGLFNLGQVINGLADDQRLKTGNKAQHIPYRNSKLTHLLKVIKSYGCHSCVNEIALDTYLTVYCHQDALGGNSKTLFLACVSPAEMNESETNSTLLVGGLAFELIKQSKVSIQ